jgi:hypothetical protein
MRQCLVSEQDFLALRFGIFWLDRANTVMTVTHNSTYMCMYASKFVDASRTLRNMQAGGTKDVVAVEIAPPAANRRPR